MDKYVTNDKMYEIESIVIRQKTIQVARGLSPHLNINENTRILDSGCGCFILPFIRRNDESAPFSMDAAKNLSITNE